MWRPIAKIYTKISDIDKISNALIVSHQNLEVVLEDVIRSWSRWTTAFFDGISNFGFRK